MHEMISLYIDDELSIKEKLVFLDRIHHDRSYFLSAADFVRYEQRLQSDVVDDLPDICLPDVFLSSPGKKRWVVPLAIAAVIVLCVLWLSPFYQRMEPLTIERRFVLYQPGAVQVEISGTFTGWKPVPLKQVGTSGYWELNLELAPGEHRFSYIIEGERVLTDPTVLAQEHDDYGGMNSIIVVENKA